MFLSLSELGVWDVLTLLGQTVSFRIPFLVCFQIGWAPRDAIFRELEDREEA